MARPGRLSRCVAGALLLSGGMPSPGRAADPQPYTVTIQPTGEGPLDAALGSTSNLVALRENAPVGPFALVARARADQGRLEAALGSFGYYDGHATVTIDGRGLDDPGLPALLQGRAGPVPVAVAITRGAVFHLRRIVLTGPDGGRGEARAALGLKQGDRALAAEVVAGRSRMLEALRADGHALAKVGEPVATLVPGAMLVPGAPGAPGADALDVSYAVEAGPRVNLGPIGIDGLDRVNEGFVRRRLLIHQGEPFDPAKIEAARQDLAQLGVFATVRAQEGKGLDAAGEIPIEIDVTERKRHAVGANLSYSTDLGASAGVTFTQRNLFGNAEKLDLGAAVTQLGGSASRRPGYNVTAALTKPDFLARDQSVTVSLQGIKESLDAYDRTAVLAGVQLTRKLSAEWSVTGGLLAQQSRVEQEGVTRDYTLLGVPVGAKYDTTGPEGLLNPTHGVKVNVTATPTESFLNSREYVVLGAVGSTYVNFGAPGRSVLALRGTVAVIEGASNFEVPPDQRLYAGGSATVRGYKYQSIGPRFADNRPIGGTSLGAVTVEYRQRFLESFGAAVFVDAGQVGTGTVPFSGGVRAGAGVGARYYTPIGPIRLDVAVPLQKRRGDDAFELYIGLGEAF